MIHHDSTAVTVLVVFLFTINWRVEAVNNTVLLFQILLLGPAALPAAAPVANKELEAVGVDANARLETYAKIAVAHFVLVMVVMEKAEMTCYGEEEVVVPWR